LLWDNDWSTNLSILEQMKTQPQEFVDTLTLADLLKPMQFKTVLLAACGLQNCEIAKLLGTTKMIIKNVLDDVYHRTSCSNSDEVVCRHFHEVSSGLLETGRLRRELAELEARTGQNLHTRLGDLLHYIN
jgi:DNA-binding NarL/FixJ family response regulator